MSSIMLRAGLTCLMVWALAAQGLGIGHAAQVDNENNLDLQIGMQKRLTLSGAAVTRVEISNEELLKARIAASDRVTLTPLEKGIVHVTIWQGQEASSDYVVTTWHTHPDRITDMVKDIPGIELRRNGSKLVVMGSVLTERDLERVRRIAEVYSEDLDNLADYDSQQFKQEALRHVLAAIGNPNVKAHFSGDSLVLTGTVHRQEDKERAEIAARAYVGGEGAVSNSIEVIDLPVEIDVFFVELRNSIGSDIGAGEGLGEATLKLPSLFFNPKFDPGDTLQAGRLSVGNIELLDLQQELRYLQTKGRARIVDQPHVSTISGKPGRIQYGGEVGIKTSGTTGGNVDYKEFGLVLDVTPEVASDYSVISIVVSLEVSQPLSVPSTGADIEFQKFSTATHGNVKMGETLVLSGLKQITKEKFKRRVPIVGQIPVLKLLFSSDAQSDVNTDIVVFLAPYLPTVKTNFTEGPGSDDPEKKYQDATRP